MTTSINTLRAALIHEQLCQAGMSRSLDVLEMGTRVFIYHDNQTSRQRTIRAIITTGMRVAVSDTIIHAHGLVLELTP